MLFAAAVTTGLSAVADGNLLTGALIALGGSLYVFLTSFSVFAEHVGGLRSTAVGLGDVVLVTATVWVTGGIHSEYVLLYYVPIVAAAIRLDARSGVAAAVLAAPLYLIVVIFAPRGSGVLSDYSLQVLQVSVTAAVLVVIFALLRRQTRLCDDLRDTLHHSLRRVAAIYDVAHAANSGADLTGVLSVILDHAARATAASNGAIFLLADGDLTPMASLGVRPAPDDTADAIPVGPAREAIAARAPITAAGKSTGSPRVTSGSGHIAYVPLFTPAGAIGVLALVSAEGRFPRRHLDFLISLCSEAALAIENAQLRSELCRLAVTDHLTGLPNRREVEQRLELEVERAGRYGRPLSVLMVDLDDLKAVNDQYGHAVGDEVLCALAHMMRDNIRSSEIAGRLGGDEFTVVLPETDSRQAAALAQRFIEILGDALRSWPGIPDPAIADSIGLSIGIAGNDDGPLSARQLTAQADLALYEAKRKGKNNAFSASRKPPVTVADN